MSLPSITFPQFTVSEILPGQDFQNKGSVARSKITSRSHHDVANLQVIINVPTTYQLPYTKVFLRNRLETALSHQSSLPNPHWPILILPVSSSIEVKLIHLIPFDLVILPVCCVFCCHCRVKLSKIQIHKVFRDVAHFTGPVWNSEMESAPTRYYRTSSTDLI